MQVAIGAGGTLLGAGLGAAIGGGLEVLNRLFVLPFGPEGPSARKRTVRIGNTDKIPTISAARRQFCCDTGINGRFIACNHGVQATLDAMRPARPAYCTQQNVGLTRG